MKNLFLLTGILGFIILQGCSGEKAKDNNSGENSTEQSPVNTNVVNTDSSQPMIPEQPVEISAEKPVIPVTTTTAAGMNPPHGQPGHRCDIEVGAPLNSPPGKTAPPTVINMEPEEPQEIIEGTPVQTQTIQAPPAGPTAPGMNPPHGQPGHDCSIAVGAPLKKK